MDLDFKEISAIAGLLLMFAGTVGVWMDAVARIKQLEKDISGVKAMRTNCDARFNKIFELIQNNEREQTSTLTAIQVLMAATVQRLDDLIQWQKNNGGPENG